MTPFTRNAALAAAATLVPAIAAAAYYPERTRALPGRISDRVRDIFETDGIEGDAKRIVSRLDDLTHSLDGYTSRSSRDIPVGALVAGGVLAAIAIPAALTAYFAPQRLRDARDAAYDYFASDEEVQSELARVSERLDELNEDIEAQRESNFDAVTAAANKGG